MRGQQFGFQRGIGQRHIDDIDLHDHGLAGVKAALEDGKARHFGGRDLQGLEEGLSQRVVGVREREFDFGQSEHGSSGSWLVVIKQKGVIIKRAGRGPDATPACRRALRQALKQMN